MKISKQVYDKYISGFLITHATVIHPRLIIFAAHAEIDIEDSHAKGFMPGPHEVPSRVIAYAPDLYAQQGGLGRVNWDGGNRRLYAAYADRVIAVNDRYRTYESKTGSDLKLLGKEVGRDYDRAVWGMKTIDNEVFTFGSMRKLHRRTGIYEWEDLTDTKKHAYLYKDIDDWTEQGRKLMDMEIGFHAMDGFSANDIYAGGDRGDMWRYDGKLWHRVDLPGNLRIDAICCAGDGYVYVGGSGGYILKGREDQWEPVSAQRDQYVFAADINAMTWFGDRLYVATSMDLFVLEEEGLTKYIYPEDGPQQHSYGHITSSDQALLAYGQHQALVFDGDKWEEIIGFPALDQN